MVLRKVSSILAIVSCSVACAPAAGQVNEDELARDLQRLNVRLRTPHYAIAGTVSDERLQEYGRCLEYIYAEYARGFDTLLGDAPRRSTRRPMTPGRGGSRRGPDPDADRFQVIIFAEQRQFQEFSNKYLQGALEHASGCYIPTFGLLLILDLQDRQQTYGVLFHEAFHQFLHHYLANPPVWLDEGLATYFETGRVTATGVVFDKPDELYWKICQKLVQADADIPLAELLTADRAAFYDPAPMNVRYHGQPITRQAAHYAEAHTLVYLLQRQPEALAHLQAYVRELAADSGRHTDQITARFFDAQTCRNMTASWRGLVLRGAP
jgi:hypothetical protein